MFVLWLALDLPHCKLDLPNCKALSAKLQGGSLVSNPFTPAARQCLSGAVATWQIEAWHLANSKLETSRRQPGIWQLSPGTWQIGNFKKAAWQFFVSLAIGIRFKASDPFLTSRCISSSRLLPTSYFFAPFQRLLLYFSVFTMFLHTAHSWLQF